MQPSRHDRCGGRRRGDVSNKRVGHKDLRRLNIYNYIDSSLPAGFDMRIDVLTSVSVEWVMLCWLLDNTTDRAFVLLPVAGQVGSSLPCPPCKANAYIR